MFFLTFKTHTHTYTHTQCNHIWQETLYEYRKNSTKRYCQSNRMTFVLKFFSCFFRQNFLWPGKQRQSMHRFFFLRSVFFQTNANSVFSHLPNIFTISFTFLQNTVIFYQFLMVINCLRKANPAEKYKAMTH